MPEQLAGVSIAEHLAALTGQRRTHVDIASRLWWSDQSFVSGRWFTNGMLAIRVFEQDVTPESVELCCDCDSQWVVEQRTATVPTCCAWQSGYEGSGTRYCECQPTIPADCKHLRLVWGETKRPDAAALIEGFAQFPRFPVTVDRVAAQNCEHGVEAYRCYTNDGRLFYVNTVFDRAVRRHQTVDEWAWAAWKINATTKRRVKKIDAPMLMGFRDRELVACVMAYAHEQKPWHEAAPAAVREAVPA